MKSALISTLSTLSKLAVCGLLASAWVASGTSAQAKDVKSLRGDVGISDTNSAPAATEVQTSDPIPRSYAQQPPLIPHTTEDFPISLEENTCLSCHGVPDVAPKPSPTHFINRAGKQLDEVSKARWFCTQCHVPQENAEPLVPNTYKGVQ